MMKKLLNLLSCSALIASSVTAQFQLPRSFGPQKEHLQQSLILQDIKNWSQQKKDAVKQLGICLIHPAQCSRSEVKQAYAYFIGIPLGIIITMLAAVGIYIGARKLQKKLGMAIEAEGPQAISYEEFQKEEATQEKLPKLSKSKQIALQNADLELKRIYETYFHLDPPFDLAYESLLGSQQLNIPKISIRADEETVKKMADAFEDVNQILGITDPYNKEQTAILQHLEAPAKAVWYATFDIYKIQ